MDLEVYGVGGTGILREGLLETISFVDACACCHLVVAPSNRFIVALSHLGVVIPVTAYEEFSVTQYAVCFRFCTRPLCFIHTHYFLMFKIAGQIMVDRPFIVLTSICLDKSCN